jgi:hypothetical protein
VFYYCSHLFLRGNILKEGSHCKWTGVNYGAVWIVW